VESRKGPRCPSWVDSEVEDLVRVRPLLPLKAVQRSARRGGSRTPMSNRGPDSGRRQHDDWTSLEAPDAATPAIAKLEAIGRSPAEVAARDSYLCLLDLSPGQTVLDVGAGTGRNAIEMARRVAGHGRVVALDPSAPLGAFARDAARRSGVGDNSGLAAGACRDSATSGWHVRLRLLPPGPAARRGCRGRGERDAARGQPGWPHHVRRGRLGDRDGLPGRAEADTQDLNFSSQTLDHLQVRLRWTKRHACVSLNWLCAAGLPSKRAEQRSRLFENGSS
jgi:SAM-dependent methyltransferase